MMATEATVEQPVDVSVTDTSLPNTQTDSTDRDSPKGDASNAAPVSRPRSGSLDEIENKQIAELVDELVNSAEVSVSGGSDTEASTKANKSVDDKGHARASSAVKKPQSFKSVSVNRTFLAAKSVHSAAARPENSIATAAPTAPTGTTGSSASKLKLVAKSVSSLGGSSKTVATNGKTAGAPDPSTVWNRNRPAPPPEPKKLSDEELMSKYGIHMADRLRPEDDRGQNNWADIDDDDDWAPDAITWTDGTKITLPQVDDTHPTPSQSATEKPKSPAPGPATSVTSAASTSAKASPSVKPGVLASGKALVLKGAPEKPILVAKPPAPPTPIKSPWATLPPVNKQPVMMNLAEAQPQLSGPRGYPPRDAPSGQTPPLTKEIAADDFSRSWRETGPAGGNSQLFNSHSGRYEPVHDRRGSRNQPALLQRHSITHEQQGPAEPSPAFQTSRTSQDSMPYGRRRTSSNVSGGSGVLANRIGKPHDIMHHAHEMGQSAPSTGSPASPAAAFSPAGTHPTPRTHHAQLWQSRPSPSQTHATLHSQGPPQSQSQPQPQHQPQHQPQPQPDANATTPSEDDIELQKRLMRERRELAIKRRMEEEAREEAAKKERIRQKLEAMGPAPERRSAKRDESKEPPTSQLQQDSIPTGLMPMPDADNEKSESVPSADPSPAAKREPIVKGKAHVNGVHNSLSQAAPPRPSQSAPWPNAHQHSDRISSSSWSGASRNVWGAPGNDRTLGNGTFNSGLSQLADSQPAQPSSATSRPAPIGPPRIATQNQQRSENMPNRLAPIGPPSGRAQGARPLGRNPWSTADIAADDRAIARENQRRVDERLHDLSERGVSFDDVQAAVKDEWRPIKFNDNGERLKDVGQVKKLGDKPDEISSKTDRREPMASAQSYRQQKDFGTQGTSVSGTSHGRVGSRFFPQSPSQDIRMTDGSLQSRSKSPTPPPPTMDDHPAYDGDAARPQVSLPPSKPVVRLPPSAVRPSSTSGPAPAPIAPPKPTPPISFAAAAASVPRAASQSNSTRPASHVAHGTMPQRPHEITMQENWQDKINTLIGRKTAPPTNTKPVSVDSASKSFLDYAHHQAPAVSLPASSSASHSSTDDTSITSKEMAEECFGEQEMGSLPPVLLPSSTPAHLYQPAEPNWGTLPAKFRIDATAAESPRFPLEFVNNKPGTRVWLQGMDEPKTIPSPHALRNKSNPRRQGLRGARHVTRNGLRGGRDGSGFTGDHSSTQSSERTERSDRPPSNRGSGRGGFRARSENWSRHSSSAQAAQS